MTSIYFSNNNNTKILFYWFFHLVNHNFVFSLRFFNQNDRFPTQKFNGTYGDFKFPSETL